MIEFKTIKWKNLLSTGNNFTEVNLNGHERTLIVGENGSGKSTILDALCFSLFSKPFRKINKSQLVNTVNCGDCKVELEFRIGKTEYNFIDLNLGPQIWLECQLTEAIPDLSLSDIPSVHIIPPELLTSLLE